MLTMTTNNDVTDNLRALKKTEEIPYFVYKDDRLTLDDSFKNSQAFVLRQSLISRFGRWLRDHSHLVQAINQGHHGFKIRLASWRAQRAQRSSSFPNGDTETAEKSELLSRSEELGTDNLVYLEPGNAV